MKIITLTDNEYDAMVCIYEKNLMNFPFSFDLTWRRWLDFTLKLLNLPATTSYRTRFCSMVAAWIVLTLNPYCVSESAEGWSAHSMQLKQQFVFAFSLTAPEAACRRTPPSAKSQLGSVWENNLSIINNQLSRVAAGDLWSSCNASLFLMLVNSASNAVRFCHITERFIVLISPLTLKVRCFPLEVENNVFTDFYSFFFSLITFFLHVLHALNQSSLLSKNNQIY